VSNKRIRRKRARRALLEWEALRLADWPSNRRTFRQNVRLAKTVIARAEANLARVLPPDRLAAVRSAPLPNRDEP